MRQKPLIKNTPIYGNVREGGLSGCLYYDKHNYCTRLTNSF